MEFNGVQDLLCQSMASCHTEYFNPKGFDKMTKAECHSDLLSLFIFSKTGYKILSHKVSSQPFLQRQTDPKKPNRPC